MLIAFISKCPYWLRNYSDDKLCGATSKAYTGVFRMLDKDMFVYSSQIDIDDLSFLVK